LEQITININQFSFLRIEVAALVVKLVKVDVAPCFIMPITFVAADFPPTAKITTAKIKAKVNGMAR
jgi:hypothetical protein